jgi:hypothetical protein
VDAELAGEAEMMAAGDVGLSARARVVRETDPKVWAKLVRIEKKFADDDFQTQKAAHDAAGTSIIMVRLALASLEAEGKIEPRGERDGQTAYGLRGPAS